MTDEIVEFRNNPYRDCIEPIPPNCTHYSFNSYSDSYSVRILPQLPDTIIDFYCECNPLISITNIPKSVIKITLRKLSKKFNYNKFPELPLTLKKLTIYDSDFENCSNELTIKLPDTLEELSCFHNNLIKLPDILPLSLEELYCSNNKLNILPELPVNLLKLQCSYNKITIIPELPSKLIQLSASCNIILQLPILNCSNIENVLFCDNNKLTELPELPINIKGLHCYHNKLIYLPQIKHLYIDSIYCQCNNLTEIPELPDTLRYLKCTNNNITKLPKLTDIHKALIDVKAFMFDKSVYIVNDIIFGFDENNSIFG